MKLKNWAEIVKSNEELSACIEIMCKINENGYEIYLVGGFVRNTILGIESDDLDISSNIPEEKLSELFEIVDIGASKSFGVNLIKYKGFTFEIANYRTDIYDSVEGKNGKGADTVKLVSTYKEDAKRRDFTINQIAVDKDGEIVDHFGGISDIEDGLIKCVGDPDKRFEEDYIRMLRCIRFYSRLNFKIENNTLEAIKSNAHCITKVSQERILKELNKMAEQTGKKFAEAIEILDKTGLLEYILPEISLMKKYWHDKDHHPEADGNVYGHVIEALKTNSEENKILNWSILLHDVGKPDSYTYNQGERHYYQHQTKGLDVIDRIADRLKFDNEMRKSIIFSCKHHMKIHEFMSLSKSKAVTLINDENWDILFKVSTADNKARQHLFDSKVWSDIESRVVSLKEWFTGRMAIDNIRKVVNGNLVMKLRPEVKPSPEMGRIIKETVEWVIDNDKDIETEIEEIKEFIKGV